MKKATHSDRNDGKIRQPKHQLWHISRTVISLPSCDTHALIIIMQNAISHQRTLWHGLIVSNFITSDGRRWLWWWFDAWLTFHHVRNRLSLESGSSQLNRTSSRLPTGQLAASSVPLKIKVASNHDTDYCGFSFRWILTGWLSVLSIPHNHLKRKITKKTIDDIDRIASQRSSNKSKVHRSKINSNIKFYYC